LVAKIGIVLIIATGLAAGGGLLAAKIGSLVKIGILGIKDT
jgi:hypothetical protein